MSSSCRPLLADDHRAVCGLIADAEELFLVYPKGQFPFTVDQLTAMLERRTAPTVLLADGKVAGFAAFYRLRRGRSAYIGNVVIGREQRGRGLGKKLVTHMCRLAFTQYDLPQVKISVHGQNTQALLLYSSLGFIPYAIQSKKDHSGKPVALISLGLQRKPA